MNHVSSFPILCLYRQMVCRGRILTDKNFNLRSFHKSITDLNKQQRCVEAGDKLPNVDLYEHEPNNVINASKAFDRGTHIIFGLPGAFTPTCSQSHLPGYVEKHDLLKHKGVTTINCVSVNDPFVMKAWGEAHQALGKVRMLADMRGEFTKAIGLEMDLTSVLGNIRSKRYAMVIEDGVVKRVMVEPTGVELSCSSAPQVEKKL
ncbi:peroxiredoxin-5, mitochondrial-like isoform X1 [Argonauta hians]